MAKTEKQDRRTRRTRRILREAMHFLIMEKGYDRVTVQDITHRADVGRSTFYAHFENKDKLHLSAFDEVCERLLKSKINDGADQTSGDVNFNSLLLFQHADESRRFYRRLAGKDAGNSFLKNMFRLTRDLVLQELQDSVPEERKKSPEIEAAAHFYASSLISMLTFWLDNELPLSPDEMNVLFKKLMREGLRAAA